MTLSDLFLTTLKDIYFAERKICKSLPKMAKAAQDPALRAAFLDHRDETEGQIDRLAQVFEALGRRPQGVTCEAILGLIEECDELLEEAPTPSPVRDAGLIAAGQAIEHYEMARYRALISWAKAASNPDIADLLQATLRQEENADLALTRMSAKINAKAVELT